MMMMMMMMMMRMMMMRMIMMICECLNDENIKTSKQIIDLYHDNA